MEFAVHPRRLEAWLVSGQEADIIQIYAGQVVILEELGLLELARSKILNEHLAGVSVFEENTAIAISEVLLDRVLASLGDLEVKCDFFASIALGDVVLQIADVFLDSCLALVLPCLDHVDQLLHSVMEHHADVGFHATVNCRNDMPSAEAASQVRFEHDNAGFSHRYLVNPGFNKAKSVPRCSKTPTPI